MHVGEPNEKGTRAGCVAKWSSNLAALTVNGRHQGSPSPARFRGHCLQALGHRPRKNGRSARPTPSHLHWRAPTDSGTLLSPPRDNQSVECVEPAWHSFDVQPQRRRVRSNRISFASALPCTLRAVSQILQHLRDFVVEELLPLGSQQAIAILLCAADVLKLLRRGCVVDVSVRVASHERRLVRRGLFDI